MDLDQELAHEALEYACYHDCGPVVFWLLHKYFNTDQLINHLSASCKKRVSCQLLYWVVKDSKVGLFSHCLTILCLLKDDHPDLCSQKDWTKLELGIKLKIVLQQILDGSSQTQCLETFYQQFPDFEENTTEFSHSEEHMLQLLFQLIQGPSIVTENDTFQNEVGSKLIRAIRHRVKHLMVNLNQTLPQPQLEKARLDMWCISGKSVKDLGRLSEKKKKFCEFLQKEGKPTSQQLLQFLRGNDEKELNNDQKVEVVERIWCSISNDLKSVAKSTSAKGHRKRTQLSIPIRDQGKSKKVSFHCQDFVDIVEEAKLESSSSSLLKSRERIILQHKPDTAVPSVTRLRSSSRITKRGKDDGYAKSSSGSTQDNRKSHDANFHENWSQGLEDENVDFLAQFRQHSYHFRSQIDDVKNLINECINSNCVVELKRFKSSESLALYVKKDDKNYSAFLRSEHEGGSDKFSQYYNTFDDKEGTPGIIVLSGSGEISPRFSSRLRETKKRNAHGYGLVNVNKDVRGAERSSSCSDSSFNSSQNCPGSVSRSRNLSQSRHCLGEDFTDCRENVQSKPDTPEREGFHSRNVSEMQMVKQKGSGHILGMSSVSKDVCRKRKKRNQKSSEEKEITALSSDSDGKESSEEMIVVGSSHSQSLPKVYDKDEEILNKRADNGGRSKLIHPRRKLRSTTAYRQVEEIAGRDPASSILDGDVMKGEEARRKSRLPAHQPKRSLKSPNHGSLESIGIFRSSLKEPSENNDVYERSSLSTHKGLNKSPGNADEESVNAFVKSAVPSPVFEYKHSSGSSSDKSVSLLTGRRILFTPDDEFIPNVSIEVIPEVSQENISNYPIDLSELASLPDKKQNCAVDGSDQVRPLNSSDSRISSGSDVNSGQVHVISETPPESPDGNLNNASPLQVSLSGSSLMLQKSEDLQSDSSSFQHAQRQQTHSFAKSSSDDVHHVSDSEDEEDNSLSHQNSQNHPRFPSLVQYLNDKVEESPLRSCSIILRKIKLDKLRLRVLLSQDSQEKP